MLERLVRSTLDLILKYPLLFWSCFSANLIGAVVGGLFWYGPMLWNSPFWALPFIPDCPLAALLGSIALYGLYRGRKWGWFNTFAAFACMKYGVWTMGFWLRHWTAGGEIEPVGVIMFITHIGLFCEGTLLVPHIGPLPMRQRLAVSGWYFLSIYVDYGLANYARRMWGYPFYPPLSPQVPVSYAFWLALLCTTLLTLGLLLLPRTRSITVTTPVIAQ